MNLREKLREVLEGDNEGRCDKTKQRPIETVVNGKYIKSVYGSSFVSENKFALDYKHGNEIIDTKVNNQVISTLCGSNCKNVDKRALLFLDTETTGLACGGGTYVFLVGLGYFTEEAFIINQYFLEDLEQEPGFLSLIVDELLEERCLVTYNGKSFDLPFIQNRLTMNRMNDKNVNFRYHIDLLHHTRRVWKEKIGSCCLSNVESNILKFQRENDIPGSIIPSLYFDYLSSCDASPMKEVFIHNMYDILSLVVLLKKISSLIKADVNDFHGDNLDDLYKVGLLYETSGNAKMAEACFRKVITDNARYCVRRRALWSLSILLKRRGRLHEAVSLWKALTGRENTLNIKPHIELAKYYEHKTGDISKAIKIVEKAIEILDREKYVIGDERHRYYRELRDVRRRMERLERRNKPDNTST